MFAGGVGEGRGRKGGQGNRKNTEAMTICSHENVNFGYDFKFGNHHDASGTFYFPYFFLSQNRPGA